MLEAMTNPAIRLGPWFTEPSESAALKPSSRRTSLHVPSFERWRLARLCEMFWHPEIYEEDLRTTYESMREDFERLRWCLAERDEHMMIMDLDMSEASLLAQTKATHRIQVVYAFHIVGMVALNSLIRAMDPSDQTLMTDAEEAARALAELAERCVVYRPLGASFIPPCLAGVVRVFFPPLLPPEFKYADALTTVGDDATLTNIIPRGPGPADGRIPT